MNTADVKTIKMFGPALSGPARLVNRDVPVCDEQAYKAAGYKRGSVPETSEASEPVKSIWLGSEEVSLEEPDPTPEPEAPAEKPARSRKKKVQE